jgi:hypothetical protein
MKIQIYFLLFITLCGTISCNKDSDFNYSEGTVGHSRIIYYPSIQIKGSRLILIHKGDVFTDPGVTAEIKGKPVDFSTSGSVDATTPGVYNLNYEAKNPEGYSASDWRTVVVIGNDIAINDFSGTYLRAATGVTSTWSKTAPGVYTVDNPGGAASGVGYKVIAINYTGSKVTVPRQLATDPTGATGIVSTANETFNATAIPVTYSWVFLAGGYGTGVRTFKKI